VSDDGKVIELGSWREAHQSPIRTSGYQAQCRHTRFLVDPKLRTVECTHCGATVDPVDAMLTVGNDWERYAGWVAHAKSERTRLEKLVLELKAEEKRVKSRLRRAQRRLDDVGGWKLLE